MDAAVEASVTSNQATIEEHAFPAGLQAAIDERESEIESLIADSGPDAKAASARTASQLVAESQQIGPQRDVTHSRQIEAFGSRAAGQPSDVYCLEDADDRDSMSAYMERLLARVRSGSDQLSHGAPSRRATPNPETLPFVAANQQVLKSASHASARQETGGEQATVAGRKDSARSLPLPRSVLDKDAVRAHLHSLREVANLSARSAISRHASRKMRGVLFFRSALTLAIFAIAALLLSSEWWAPRSLVAYGWGASSVGVVALLEWLRLLYGRRRAVSFEPRAKGVSATTDSAAGNERSAEQSVEDAAAGLTPLLDEAKPPLDPGDGRQAPER